MGSWRENGLFATGASIYAANQKFFISFFDRCRQNDVFLDLGCMQGGFTHMILKHICTKNVYGIEIDPKMVRKAVNAGIKAKTGDLSKKFPFKSKVFDIVSANQILEHVYNTDNFFREVNRVLKIGGYVVISTPNLSSFHSIFFILMGQQPPNIHLSDIQVGNFLRGTKIDYPGHYKAFNMAALRDLGVHYGFEVEKIGGFGFYFLPSFLQDIASKLIGKYGVYITIRLRKVRDISSPKR